MLNWDSANAVFRELEAACPGDADYADAKQAFFAAAWRYARIRADCAVADAKARMAMDSDRTAAHNALIDACNILSRHMAKKGQNIAWRKELGDDRKVIGDFACYLHAIQGISAR